MKQDTLFPQGSIHSVTGKCMYLSGNDIDTDRIIPARFLKCVNFDTLGNHVFIDDRSEKKGMHPFDQNHNKTANILIVDKNFGCGSSREHAPQALMRWGIRAIIGKSFAEIFYGNCLTLGIPCVIIKEEDASSLINFLNKNHDSIFKLELEKKMITSKEHIWEISIDNSSQRMFLSGGWDATKSLINQIEKIQTTKSNLPYINSFQKLQEKPS